MESMPSRDFVNVWYGFCRILYDLLIYGMGCMNVDGFLNVLYGIFDVCRSVSLCVRSFICVCLSVYCMGFVEFCMICLCSLIC